MMKWHWFPADLLEIAQEEALEALLFVAQQDEEWVVRYSAVVGLQALAMAIPPTSLDWRSRIESQLAQMANDDRSLAVRGRVFLAQQTLKETAKETSASPSLNIDRSSALSEADWQTILVKLYDRKGEERLVFAEGDPRRYRNLAGIVAPKDLKD